MCARLKRNHEAYDEAKTYTQPFWKTLVRNVGLQSTLVEETFELLAHEGFKYTARVQKQITRCFKHIGSTLLCERGFKWLRDASKDSSSNMTSELTLWETPTRRNLLGKHDFNEVKPDQCVDVSGHMITKSLFGPRYKNSSDTFHTLPGRGAPAWPSKKAEDLPTCGGMTDCMEWSYSEDKMAEGGASWRTQLIGTGTFIRKKTSKDMYFVLGSCGMMLYMIPARRLKIGKTFLWSPRLDASVSSLIAEPILRLDDWRVTPTEVVSPAALFHLNGRKPLDALPDWPAQVMGDETTILKWSAQAAFKGLGKQALLKLDKEEVGSVTTETTLGQILFIMIKRVLDISDAKAADILSTRCRRADNDGTVDLLQSQTVEDVLSNDNSKKDVATILKAMDDDDEALGDIASVVKAIRCSCAPPAAKKANVVKRKWPDGDAVEFSDLLSLQPPKAKLWYDSTAARYQNLYGKSSCSRALNLWGQLGAAKEVTRWAWTLASLQDGLLCHVDGLF